LAISKEKKQQMVADYVDKVSRSKAVILADYRGLSVAKMTELRRRLREVDGAFQVIKNTLFTRALEETNIPVPSEHLQGPVAAGFCFGDSPPIAKVLVDFGRETQILQVHGAILGERFLDAKAVQTMADLPPREILLAQLLGAVQGPMSSLASTVAGPLRDLVQVLKARSEQGQEATA
jgi:large subunit ribosomal protein L10